MHAAFSDSDYDNVVEALDLVCNKLNSLEKKEFYRPRFGIFVQPDCCAMKNASTIPTFTCNFKSTVESSEKFMENMMELIYAHDDKNILRGALLRVRCEGELSNLKYDLETKKMKTTFDMLCAFPKSVKGLEYYDAHIHVLGLTFENADEKWERMAKCGIDHNMPIIINKLKLNKGVIKPFYTKRWYNTTLEEAIESLGLIYQDVYTKLVEIGLKPVLIPEFEITMNDPDCQITDRKWMPTPFCKFDLEEKFCKIPSEISFKISSNFVCRNTPIIK